jgi:hypothetical protein
LTITNILNLLKKLKINDTNEKVIIISMDTYTDDKSNIGINLSLYNGYMKTFLVETGLNPNYTNNYKIFNSYANNNFWENNGFSIKYAIIMGFYGVCYNTFWKNIQSNVKHLSEYGKPSDNILLINDYIHQKTNHIYITKIIKLSIKINNNNLDLKVIDISINNDKFIHHYTNDQFVCNYVNELIDDIYENDNKLDNFKYNKINKNFIFNSLIQMMNNYELPILISLMLPTDTKKNLNNKNVLTIYNDDEFDDAHACIMSGYKFENNQLYFKILSSWGKKFGDNGSFWIQSDYLFLKSMK